MIPPELDTISIRDFRSVRGTVSVPLGAQIVLLHGANGAGKSTVMSAIELALTGVVSDLDNEDRRHLVHRSTDQAAIELATAGAKNTLTLRRDGEVSGESLASPRRVLLCATSDSHLAVRAGLLIPSSKQLLL